MEENQIPPAEPEPNPVKPTSLWGHVVIACIAGAAYAFFGIRAIEYKGDYGLALFVFAPMVLGFVLGCTGASRGFAYACASAYFSLVVASLIILALEVDGFICVIMAAPLGIVTALLGTVLGVGVWELVTGRVVRMVILLLSICLAPAMLAAESTWPRTPPVYQVTSTIEIDAPPSVVWPHVVAFPPIPEPTEMTFRAGIAYPIAATMRLEGTDRIRECVFNTGTIVEPVEIWEPPYRLRFAVTEMPEPMIETGLYGELHPPHLNGYLMAKHGEFVLTELPGGRTRVDGTSWYSHGLWPAWYWRLWSDELIHSIHDRVLRHIKALAEAK